MHLIKALKDNLKRCFKLQINMVEKWHQTKLPNEFCEFSYEKDSLESLVLENLFMNFKLWHIEDIARKKDVSAVEIAQCKRSVDTLNQKRTDAFEKIDMFLVSELLSVIENDTKEKKYNTESLGMAIDRAAILALKIFHMNEQIYRNDVDSTHKEKCSEKVRILYEQRQDLICAIEDLIDDYHSGLKHPKLYFQFKMYNDPMLNPELYENKKT